MVATVCIHMITYSWTELEPFSPDDSWNLPRFPHWHKILLLKDVSPNLNCDLWPCPRRAFSFTPAVFPVQSFPVWMFSIVWGTHGNNLHTNRCMMSLQKFESLSHHLLYTEKDKLQKTVLSNTIGTTHFKVAIKRGPYRERHLPLIQFIFWNF